MQGIALVRIGLRGWLREQQLKLVTDVTSPSSPVGDRVVDAMITLAHCAPLQQILVAGAKCVELTFELNRRGFLRAASAANCGKARGQYDIALVDWRKRTFKSLDTTLEWLLDFLTPQGLLIVWVDP